MMEQMQVANQKLFAAVQAASRVENQKKKSKKLEETTGKLQENISRSAKKLLVF